ncbi:MAG: hypothetical protein LBJ41_07415 [Treponema sp.]|nr:hypothetical protein [Treponema sp.]
MFNNPDAELVTVRQRGFEDAVRATSISIVCGVYAEHVFWRNEKIKNGFINAIEMLNETQAMLDSFGIKRRADEHIAKLTMAGQQLVEIIKAGINIKQIRLFMYVFSGIMASVTGVILLARTYSGCLANGNGRVLTMGISLAA